MHDTRELEPDAVFGRRVRITCGALLGVMLSLWFDLYAGPFHFFTAAVVVIFAAIACGLLAARYGDAFWHEVIAIFRG